MRFYAFSSYDRFNHIGVSIGPSLVYGVSISMKNAPKWSIIPYGGLGPPLLTSTLFYGGLGAPITLRVYYVAYMHSCEPRDLTHLV